MHLVITDSGLGGLNVSARLERALRDTPPAPGIRLTYVNAWPETGRGYNSLPDMASRASVFDSALRRMREMGPDAIVIACNTLSIIYEATEFRRDPGVPVQGIVDAGVRLFEEALDAEPASTLLILGTRTTVESGAHRNRLVLRGIDPGRISGASCHGLATAIEEGPERPEVAALIDTCMQAAAASAGSGEPLFAGLCCTHYEMVEDRIRGALAAHTGRLVGTLDPNARLVEDISARLPRQGRMAKPDSGNGISVEVISKIALSAAQRRAIGAVIERVSPATAHALQNYRHVPDLF